MEEEEEEEKEEEDGMEEIMEEVEEEGETESYISPSLSLCHSDELYARSPRVDEGFGEPSIPSATTWSSSLAAWSVYWGSG